MGKLMGILERQLYEGLIYAKMPIFQEKAEKAKKSIEAMLSRAERSYVALSWGKHSIVMAHQVYCVDPSVLMVHWSGPDANIIADFDHVRDRFLSSFSLDYLELSEGPLGRLRKAVKDFISSHNVNGVFLGLCAYESKGRKITARRSDADNLFVYSSGLIRCCPIISWTQDDVAAYIALHNLPLLSTYHRYGLEARTRVGVTPGFHSENGIDMISRAKQEIIKARWRRD